MAHIEAGTRKNIKGNNMKKLSTHRLIQIHNTQDACESISRINGRCARKAMERGQMKQFAAFMKAECKVARIANICKARLEDFA